MNLGKEFVFKKSIFRAPSSSILGRTVAEDRDQIHLFTFVPQGQTSTWPRLAFVEHAPIPAMESEVPDPLFLQQ